MKLNQWLNYLLVFLWLSTSLLVCISVFTHPATRPTEVAYPITIRSDGFIVQNKQIVATVNQGLLNQTVTLQLKELNQSQGLEIQFPKPLSLSEITVVFNSVQGTKDMRWQLTTPTLLTLVVPPLLDQSYTTATINFPLHYLSLSPPLQTYSYITNISILGWLEWGVSLFIATFIILFIQSHPLNRRKNKSQLSQPPQELDLAGFALLMHGGIRNNDIAALLIDLARRHAFEILANDEDLKLIHYVVDVSTLKPYEKLLLDIIAPPDSAVSNLSSILKTINRDVFSEQVSTMYTSIYESIQGNNFFKEDPRATHLRLKTIGIILQLGAITEVIGLYIKGSPILTTFILFIYAQFLAGYIFYTHSKAISYLTPLGSKIWSDCYSFINFLNYPYRAPSEWYKTDIYYRYLPYAVISGVNTIWSSRFQDFTFYIPEWFRSANHILTTPQEMTAEMDEATTRLADAFAIVKDPNVD